MKWMRLFLLTAFVVTLLLPSPDAVASCWAGVSCTDGSNLSCSCSTGGTCNSYPSGSPWGGYVSCSCSGKPTRQIYCNAPTCTQASCNAQCGGPGSGVCSGNNCYCY